MNFMNVGLLAHDLVRNLPTTPTVLFLSREKQSN